MLAYTPKYSKHEINITRFKGLNWIIFNVSLKWSYVFERHSNQGLSSSEIFLSYLIQVAHELEPIALSFK